MIKTILDPQHDLTIQKCIGKSTKEKYVKANRAFYKSHPTANLIWDFSEASLNGTTASFIEELSSFVSRLAISSDRKGKTAVIATGDLEYGFSRMFQMRSESKDFPFEICVFKTFKEAKKWILSEE